MHGIVQWFIVIYNWRHGVAIKQAFGATKMNAVFSKLAVTSEYLNTRKMVLVYGELCRRSNKNGNVNFSARFECAKQLTQSGVKVNAFGRYSKQGSTILAHVRQENRLLANGWTKLC